MEALHQGISAALVLLGIAAMLFGIATLWRAVGQTRASQQELQLDRALNERASERLRDRAEQHRRRFDLVHALLPAATAALGHWLGSQSGRHGREVPSPAGCYGCIPRPMPPFAPEDDDEHIELDVGSLLEALSDTPLGEWLSRVMQGAKANHATAPDEADFVNMPTTAPPAN